jgi:radical SAM superfamily enzyme YgiQ (UPF0313 family)
MPATRLVENFCTVAGGEPLRLCNLIDLMIDSRAMNHLGSYGNMDIGLIAMSGIRVCDAELLQLGLTLPGFVERSKTIASLPSLGLLTLAGMTPSEHTCHYIEVDDLRQADASQNSFDLVAISSFSAQINDAYALANLYRAQGVPVVLGGLHVSALPDEAMTHADAVVVGEGETVWLELLADMESGRLKKKYEADGQFDLGLAPLPSYELLDMSKYNRLTVQASRGCPWRCEFCASSILISPHYKQKPIPRVVAEIDAICGLWKRPFLEFTDDNAFVNKTYWKQLLEILSGRHLRWFVETDISVHKDEDLLRLAREAGCAEVLIGLESPVEDGLLGLELRKDWKRLQLPEYRDAIFRIQSHGIRVNGCFVIGLDDQTPEIFDRVREFVEETELYDVQITIPTPFPGTPLYQRLEAAGRLLFPHQWERYTLFDINYLPLNMSEDQLRDGFHALAKELYSEEATKRRRDNFNDKYLRKVSH